MCKEIKKVISLSQVDLQQDTEVHSITSELQKDQCNICNINIYNYRSKFNICLKVIFTYRSRILY